MLKLNISFPYVKVNGHIIKVRPVYIPYLADKSFIPFTARHLCRSDVTIFQIIPNYAVHRCHGLTAS